MIFSNHNSLRYNMTARGVVIVRWAICVLLVSFSAHILFIYGRTCQAQPQAPVLNAAARPSAMGLHPYFDRDDHDVHLPNWNRPPTIIVGQLDPDIIWHGYRIPSTFQVTCYYPPYVYHPDTKPAAEVNDGPEYTYRPPWPIPPLTFILVKPGQCSFDGLNLDVKEPFYISQTVISNAQAFVLTNYSILTDEKYKQFSNSYAKSLMFPGLAADDPAQQVAVQYAADPNKPFLVSCPADAYDLRMAFCTASRMYVSLPTLGQYFLAMRAGNPTRYWWGDDWNQSPYTPKYSSEPYTTTSEYSGFINVDQGERNPLGLINMCYNVPQIIETSDHETNLIRLKYSSIKDGQWETRDGQRYSQYLVGDSWQYNKKFSEEWGFTLRHIVASGRTGYMTFQFSSALRLVIELPPN